MILQPPYTLAFTPQRIVSLVPSQTELLHYLGLEEETVGITKFCIHPKEWYRNKTRVGGTKTVNPAAIKKLQPHLIIANKEENVKEQIEELANEYNVLVTDVNNVSEALQMISCIGTLTGKDKEATQLITRIENNFSTIHQPAIPIKTAYLIWNNPYMAAGGGTFINDMMDKAGLKNIFQDNKRYPGITIADLQIAGCQLLMLSSEPYPFKQKHIDELQQHLPNTKIILADGEMFSWYGSRMLLVPEYLHSMRREW
ncbi:helical backbone metal receptor [Ferruginibacter sp. SUN106]|uniref:helical backbone metal receptor n=1 Tax=Ferruginibacter sp. SUN106 TaxID=2978348 RepID=UPI003D35D2B8